MGDFNIDLLSYNKHSDTENFLNLMLQNLLIPQITSPTRINENDNFTLIDNIFFNDHTNALCNRNLLCPVTDHLPNFLKIKIESNVNPTRSTRDHFLTIILQHRKMIFQTLIYQLNCKRFKM